VRRDLVPLASVTESLDFKTGTPEAQARGATRQEWGDTTFPRRFLLCAVRPACSLSKQ